MKSERYVQHSKNHDKLRQNEDTHKSRELRDDTDEKRTEEWANKKGTGDADATLLDDNFNPDSSHSNENFGSMGMGESYVN